MSAAPFCCNRITSTPARTTYIRSAIAATKNHHLPRPSARLIQHPWDVTTCTSLGVPTTQSIRRMRCVCNKVGYFVVEKHRENARDCVVMPWWSELNHVQEWRHDPNHGCLWLPKSSCSDLSKKLTKANCAAACHHWAPNGKSVPREFDLM